MAKKPIDPKLKFNSWFIFLAIAGVFFINNLIVSTTTVERIPYSRFLILLDQNRIGKLYISDNMLNGELRDPKEGEKAKFVTVRVDPSLAQLLDGKDVEFLGVIESTFLRDLISWVLPAVVFVAIWLFAMRQLAKKGGGMGGSFMSVGKSKAKVYVEKDTKVSFADVAGADEAKDELIEIVSFLKEPEKYGRLGARIPKGTLLVGPPGTGKTLLAKAVAGEAGVPFFSISGSEFVEMFVGVGAARVRDLFEQARKQAPAIIFIDELDALGKARGMNPMGGHDEKEQTLNQLLVELDGFDSRMGIVLLAATNRPEILDAALLRAGRFDRQVLVDRPDKLGRIAILKVHIKKIPLIDPELALENIAAITTGFSGADIENLVNEAALVATRRGGQQVTLADFNAAVERIVAGLERKNRILNGKERRIVAFHEMGHAIVGSVLQTTEKLHKVSIVPRGIGALGYTMQRPTEDRFLMTKEELEGRVAVLLGGRAAEELTFGHLSTGAADDITKATNIARSMVTQYGMCSALGFVDYEGAENSYLGGRGSSQKRVSDETEREIDKAIKAIIDGCYRHAMAILTANQKVLEMSAAKLLEVETLDEAMLTQLLSEVTVV